MVLHTTVAALSRPLGFVRWAFLISGTASQNELKGSRYGGVHTAETSTLHGFIIHERLQRSLDIWVSSDGPFFILEQRLKAR